MGRTGPGNSGKKQRQETASGKSRGPRTSPKSPSHSWILEWAKTLVFGLIIFLGLRTFIVESFVITSGSMENTLLVGDFLLVNKTVFGSPIPGTPWRIPGYGEPHRGNMVVFRARHAPGLDIVKRLVGVPGDTLSMRAGVLYINGKAQQEPYVLHDRLVPDAYDPDMEWQRAYLVARQDSLPYRPTRDNWGPIVVPPERYFMMGDNREHSLDSRFWGFAERKKLKGKPFFMYYSYDKTVLKPFRFITAARLGRIGPL